jgi:hypothetical protein
MQLTDVFVGYAGLLSDLADQKNMNEESFQKLNSDLYTNSRKLSSTAGENPDDEKLSILSSAAVQLFKTYTDSKRYEHLVEAVRENQPTVEKYSKKCIDLIRIMKSIVQNTYDQNYFEHSKLWRNSAGKSERKQLANDIVSMNDSYIVTLALLESVENLYGRLPRAHQELASGGVRGIAALRQDLQSMKNLKDRLQKEESKNE